MSMILLLFLGLLIPLGAAATGPTIDLVVTVADAVTATRAASDAIGVARMLGNGTLILELRAAGPDGAIGESRLMYPPDHPEYRRMLDHIGPMSPGDSRPVPPWPDPAPPSRP